MMQRRSPGRAWSMSSARAGRSKRFPEHDVGEDAQGTRLHEPVALGVGVLVVGRDARVAQDVAHAGRGEKIWRSNGDQAAGRRRGAEVEGPSDA